MNPKRLIRLFIGLWLVTLGLLVWGNIPDKRSATIVSGNREFRVKKVSIYRGIVTAIDLSTGKKVVISPPYSLE